MWLSSFGLPTTAMASIRSFNRWTSDNHHPQTCSKPVPVTNQTNHHLPPATPMSISRRCAFLISTLPFTATAISLPQQPSLARERRNRKIIPLEDYLTSPNGLKYYDVIEGNGPVAEKGLTVQPYEFKVGAPPGKERKRDFVDNPNGLFSAQAAPKPPAAMYSITEGMRVGGKRTVIVPPEAGYGQKGMNEIPPGATFEMNVELLQVVPPEGK